MNDALSRAGEEEHAPTPAVLPVATRPRGQSRAGGANVERILDAALGIFAQYGLQGARIEAIARAAGLSKTNLLYYFRSKDALYLAVLTRILDLWLEPLRAIDARRDPRAAVAAYVTRKLEYARDYPAASRLFAIEVMQGAPVLGRVLATDLKALVDDKTAILAGWMREGRLRSIDPHHLIFMIWATTQHYADFERQVETLTGRTLADPAFFDAARETLVGLIAGGLEPG
jgi:TetR/AcrR family transcriptional regulator